MPFPMTGIACSFLHLTGFFHSIHMILQTLPTSLSYQAFKRLIKPKTVVFDYIKDNASTFYVKKRIEISWSKVGQKQVVLNVSFADFSIDCILQLWSFGSARLDDWSHR